MTPLAALAGALRCPVCAEGFLVPEAGWRCASGHGFDLAKQGYLNLLMGKGAGSADAAAMVEARARIQGAGRFGPLAAALAEAAARVAPGARRALDVGAGTGYYLGRVLDALPEALGLALDLSKPAARRAARAHPRMAAVVGDATRLPVSDGAFDLATVVFAPRAGAELRRALAPGGALLVVTPLPDHLAALREALGMIRIDPEKERRLASALAPFFEREGAEPLRWPLSLGPEDALAIAGMGPSAHHGPAAAPEGAEPLRRGRPPGPEDPVASAGLGSPAHHAPAAAPSGVETEAAVQLTVYRPR